MANEQLFEFSYSVPIVESGFMNDDFMIAGTAINSVITSNNHKFIAEELRASANTLTGVPLLIDHRNEVSAIKGRVILGEYDEENNRVNFKARVKDVEIRKMIKDGLINSVSVGATVKHIDEDGDTLIPRGITFKELSLVAVPADSGATFNIALKEAYKSKPIEKALVEAPKIELKEEKVEVKEVALPEIKSVITTEQVSNELKGGLAIEMETQEKVEKVVEMDKSADMMKSITDALAKLNDKLSAMEGKMAIKEEKKAEVEEEMSVGKYKIQQGLGSIKGYSFAIVR